MFYKHHTGGSPSAAAKKKTALLNVLGNDIAAGKKAFDDAEAVRIEDEPPIVYARNQKQFQEYQHKRLQLHLDCDAASMKHWVFSEKTFDAVLDYKQSHPLELKNRRNTSLFLNLESNRLNNMVY